VTAPGGRRRPQDIAVVLPEDWWIVPLRPAGARQRSIRQLVDKQFQGLDDQPILRSDMARKFEQAGRDAAAAKGRWMAVSLQRAAGIPIPAALVVSWLELGPGQGGGHLSALADELTGEPADLAMAQLPCGRVVRRLRSSVPVDDPELATEELDPVNVDYWLEFPSDDGMVQLSFSTPLAVLAEALVELFDAIIGTVRWVYTG